MAGVIMYFLIWVPMNLLKVLWWRWSVEGLENLPPRGKGMVLAVNHMHWLDIPLLGASLPLSHRPSWIAKVEILKGSLLTWFFRNMLVIPIKRGKRDLTALIAAEDALKSGEVLVIFPEGHRSNGELLQGRNGAVRLAVRSGVPIIPVAIWGTEYGFKGAMSRNPIHLRVGPAYYPQVENPDHIPADKMNEQTELMMLKIAALMPESYRGFYREHMLAEK